MSILIDFVNIYLNALAYRFYETLFVSIVFTPRSFCQVRGVFQTQLNSHTEFDI